jgi:anti-sigma factor RsiW
MSMTIACLEAEEHLLEALDGVLPDDVRLALDHHLSTCVRCTDFAARLRAVDAQLATAFRPTPPPASIAMTVRARVRRERQAAVRESLPDLIHLAGCTVITLLSAALLPIEASVTIAAGIGVTCVTYVGMAVMRWSIEAAAQSDW